MAYRLPRDERVADPPRPQKYYIDKWYGMDARSGDIDTAIYRSPDCVNMTWDQSPYLTRTRNGYLPLIDPASPIIEGGQLAKINGIHLYLSSGNTDVVIHAGTKLYKLIKPVNPASQFWTVNTTPLYEGLLNAPTQSFMMTHAGVTPRLYIVGGGVYLRYDGSTCAAVANDAGTYIPTTTIQRSPTGGGTAFEPVNLLQKRRKNSFLITSEHSTEKTFALDFAPLDARVEGNASTYVTVKKLNNDGTWTELTETTHFTVNRTTGTITFLDAPGQTPLTGQDNLTVEAPRTVSDYAGRINNCSISGSFAAGNDVRVFLSGNAELPNIDWRSWLDDATYFPDVWFTRAGEKDTAIMGYLKLYRSQIVIKAGTGREASTFLRGYKLDDSGNATFPYSPGAAGSAGAIAKRSFALLNDDPIYLASSGILGYTGTNVDGELKIEDRSALINDKLLREPGLESAVGITYGDKYHMFVNGHVYVCNGRVRYVNEYNQIQYEWYYWDDIPCTAANVYLSGSDYWLLFGAAGIVYRFRTDSDGNIHRDYKPVIGNTGIPCKWVTPIFSGGNYLSRATANYMRLLLMPRVAGSCDVYAIVNGRKRVKLATEIAGIGGFANGSFAKSTFSGASMPYGRKRKIRLKRFDFVQFEFSNNGSALDGFALVAYEMRYYKGN